jgi:hypothetical protein
MTTTGDMGGGTRLAGEIERIYSDAKSNRGPLEDKWNRNRDYFRREIAVALRKGEGTDWRSDITPNLTKQKVMTAVSTVLGYYMPDGEIPFAYEAWTPETDRVLREEQEAALSRAQDLVKAQLRQCRASKTLRKCVFSAALYGMYAYQLDLFERMERRWRQDAGGLHDFSGVNPEHIRWVDENHPVVQPGVRYASIWNCFWDVEAEDPDEGAFLIHRVAMPARRLRQMAEANPDLYSLEQVKRALLQQGSERATTGEDEHSLPPNQRGMTNRTHNSVVVEFHGWLPKNVVEDFEKEWASMRAADEKAGRPTERWEPDSDEVEAGDEVHVAAAVVNGVVVMFSRSRSCDRPIRFGRYELHADEIEAEGVADNVEDDMKAMTGLLRSAMDNAMLSGDVIFAVREGDIDSPFSKIEPGARIELAPDCANVHQAIQQLRVMPTTAATIDLIRLLTQQAEDNSMMPRIASGLNTMQSRVTATQVREQMGQFEQGIGQLSALLDEHFVEPTVEWFHQCNMLDPQIPHGQKGDYRVAAKGYANFRKVADAALKMDNLFAFILMNPSLSAEAKPRDMAIAKGRELGIDAEKYLMTAEEKRENAQMMAQMQEADPFRQLGLAKLQAEVAKLQAGAENLAALGQKAQAEAAAESKKTNLMLAEFMARLEGGGGAGGNGGLAVEAGAA